MDWEERTTKYAKGAKKQAKLQSITFAYFAHFVVKSQILIRNNPERERAAWPPAASRRPIPAFFS
jgi:hypothetical protein